MTAKKKPDGSQLSHLSRLNVWGQEIPLHRSIDRISFPRSRILVVMVLPVIFTLGLAKAADPMSRGWRVFFEFWISKLDGITANVILSTFDMLGFKLNFPEFVIATTKPDRNTLLITLAGTLCFQLVSFRIPASLVPLIYWIRVIVIIQLSTIVFFMYWPENYPYSTAHYLDNLSLTGIAFLFVVPFIHALVYYILDFTIWKKVTLTLFSLLFVAVAVPFEVMVHTYILVHFSILFMPLLYFVFGVFPLILGCMGLYGWAMSWKRRETPMLVKTHRIT